ncbi:hypothetical protein FG171_00350 [Serratia marcescens]|nr:hypothetical protein FG171_00350 [Serratia marcescens]
MILHARKCTFHPLPHQYWRGLRPFMQLHEKLHMKCAGEAGIALRATSINSRFLEFAFQIPAFLSVYRSLSKPLQNLLFQDPMQRKPCKLII